MGKAPTRSRWLVLATLGLLLLALVLGGQACPGRGAKPAPTRFTRPAPRRMAVRPAPVTPAGGLRAAVTRTKTEVDRGDWAAADRSAANLGSLWQPIRTGRTWPTTDLAAFESAYTRLRAAIKAKDKGAADRALAEMLRLERRHPSVSRPPRR